MRARWVPWSAGIVVAVSGCLPGGRVPGVSSPVAATARGASLRPTTRAPRADDGPFRVVFAGPTGDVKGEPQPQLVFSRPVRALGARPGEPELGARFVPDVPGRWEWMGTSSARFVPTSGFAMATRYQLVVDRPPRALDGEALSSPVELAFATRRPHVVQSRPLRGATDVGPHDELAFELSQPIGHERLARAVTLTDRSGTIVPIELGRAPERPETWVLVSPRAPLRDGERYTLSLASGVLADVGDLGAEGWRLTFTMRPTLGVTSIDCARTDDGRCASGSDVVIDLSDEQRPSELRARVAISPKVRLAAPSDDAPTTTHTLSGDFRDGVTYTVTVTPGGPPPRPRLAPRGVQATPLRPLLRGASESLRFAPAETGVHFSAWGTFVPTSPLPLAARAEESSIARAGVAPIPRASVVELARPRARLPALEPERMLSLPARPSVKDPPGWTSLAALTPPSGPVLLGASWEGALGEPRSSTGVLQRSELALDARVTPEGTLAWVTSLTTGAPLAGVEVEARDARGRAVTATTDADGVARLATAALGLDDEAGAARRGDGWMVLLATRGDDWIFRRADVPRAAPPRGALFSDRGLYRPGETIRWKGLVRRPTSRGLEPITGRQVDVEHVDAAGHATRATATLGAWGTFDLEQRTPPDGPSGGWTTRVRLDGEVIATERARVAEYRPSSFSVDTKLDRASVVRGEQVSCATRAGYLYGGSLEGARVRASFYRQRGAFKVPGLDGFTLDEHDDGAPLAAAAEPREAKLGRDGVIALPFAAGHPAQRGPELWTCDVTVTDAAWEHVASSATALVHPADVYVALEDRRWGRVFAGERRAPKVLTVTPTGERRARRVELELVRHRRDPKRRGEVLAGEPVARCQVETGAEPRSCALVVPDGPMDDVAYFVERATTKEPQGVVSASSRLIPSAPPRPVAPLGSRPRPRPRPEATLRADQETYARGDTARLVATSPFGAGHVLVTTEREGIMSHVVRAVGREPFTIEVPITAETAPYARAVATFVSPLADRTSPRRTMQATAQLEHGWAADRLSVAVRPSKALAAPGDELDVEVDVRRADGSPARAEVTLYAADEGTLRFIGYRVPDPIDSFFWRRDATVSETHTRDELGGLLDWEAELRDWGKRAPSPRRGRLGGSHRARPPVVRMGATSVDGARRDFDQSAFFLPRLETDERGVARAHVKLPESLTTYRVMAFAVTTGAEMGSAAAPVTTSAPLQVRPVLPRVVRAGDRFAVTAMAANNGAEPLAADVTLALTGLRAVSPLTRRVSLAPGASERVMFDVAADAVGDARVTLSIASDRARDAAELPLRVASPATLETAALHGQVTSRADEEIAGLADLRPDVGGLDVTVSTSPVTGLGAGLTQLVTYPYGCTEQTTSRLVPLLALRPLALALGVALPDDVAAAAADGVRRILASQQLDGGFGLWGSSQRASPWLSAYATWGLSEAALRGVPVDDVQARRARGYLLGLLSRWGDDDDARVAAPFALDVLAGWPAPDVDVASLYAVAEQLFRARDRLPVFSRAHLLHAMTRVGAEPGAREALATELAATVHLDGPLARVASHGDPLAAAFDSPTRSSALVLRALLAHDPRHPLVMPLALGLVRDRAGGTWRTTQETAWALLALDAVRAAAPPSTGAQAIDVRLGDAPLLRHAFAPGALADARASVPMSRLAGGAPTPLSFAATGGAPLFYEASLRFAPRSPPTDDVASGLELHRRYFAVPDSIGERAVRDGEYRVERGDRFDEGAWILVELELTTASARRHVVVDDAIPGGFEGVDLRAQGGPRWLLPLVRAGGATRSEQRDDRALFFFDELPPGSIRLVHVVRATSRGTFVAPAARAEEMYAPETFGRTAARLVTVAPRSDPR